MREQLMTRRAPGAVAEARARQASSPGGVVVRGLTVAAVLLSADIHLALYADGFADISVIGPLFLLNAAGGIVIGVVLLVWRHWLPVLGAIGFGALTLAAFLLSRTVGLFGVHELTWDAQSVLAMIADAVAFAGGVALLLRSRERGR